MNHWAYDAIGQLAAHGILSGYPDGLYKGKQQTTRYEMASALARALAVVDMTKASKQDVEMLKKLVVEFKDELEALGVRVDELDERVAVLEDRLGGWHIHGDLALDINYQKNQESPDPDGEITFDDAKIWIERTWGEDDEYQFVARLNGGDYAREVAFDRFYVEMPFFFDSRLTLGRFAWNWEKDYKVGGIPATGSWLGDTQITDWQWNGLGLTKNFGLGTVQAVVAHSGGDRYGMNNRAETIPTVDTFWNDWMFMLRGSFQFTEQFALDLGGQAFIGDNADRRYTDLDADGIPDSANVGEPYQNGDIHFKNLWTIFAGLRFNFNENVAFKGIFYHQDMNLEQANTRTVTWDKVDRDNANHWAVMFDIKQALLKFTSVWLEYGQYKERFIARSGDSIFYAPTFGLYFAPDDMKYWRVVLGQEWNDKWATHLFYYGYKVDNMGNDGKDWKPAEFGLGVQYNLNDYTTMGLNYVHVKSDLDGTDNDNVVRFRTAVSF